MDINRQLLLLFIVFCSYGRAEDLYWIGNSGNWNDPSNWSYSSGGVSANKVPTDQDVVFFDELSFSSPNQVVSFSDVKAGGIYIDNVYHPTFNGTSLELFGNFEITTNINLNADLILSGKDEVVNTIQTSGFMMATDVEVRSGKWELKNHLILGDDNNLTIEGQVFKSNEYTLKAGSINFGKVKTYLENSSILGYKSIDLGKANKKGGNPILVLGNDNMHVITGNYIGAVTKDASNSCGSLTLDLTISSDYNGSDISCNGACDGELTIVASGTAGPYSYSFNNIAGPFTGSTVFTSLCAGTYTIFVIDSSNVIAPGVYGICSVSDNLVDPTVLSISIPFVVNPSCHNVCDGSVVSVTSGGTGTTTVTWNTGHVGNNPTNLCVGDNIATLVDDNGCTAEDTVEISSPSNILFDIAVTPPTCNGDTDAALSISNVSGGNGGAFTYNYTPAPASGQGTPNPNGFGPGNITVSVFDVAGCQQDSIVNIADPPVLVANTADVNPATCFGSCDGSVSALPVGGVPGYSFEWFDDNTGLTTTITDSIATGLCAGSYFVEITDANGCVRTSSPVTITEPSEITFTFVKTDVDCADSCTGVATATVMGGTLGYTYSWVDIANATPIGGNSPTVNMLCPGEYQISVVDGNGCPSDPDTVEILNALPIDVTFTATSPDCYDICNGEITATPTNTTGFIFSWQHGPSTATISNLCTGGDYILTTTNDSGCVEVDTFNLVVPDVYDITTVTTDLDCFEDSDGTIDVTVNLGGNGGPYSYTWTPAGITGDGTPNVSGLPPGSYSVLINDGPGTCDTTLNFVLNSPPDLTVTGTDIVQVSCAGLCDAQISALPAGGTPGYTFEWIDDATGTVVSVDSIATALCPGSYYVRVTDVNGCIDSSAVIVIANPSPIIVTDTGYDLTCFDICDGAASVDVTGGTPGYTYVWTDIGAGTNVGITDSISGLCPGDYRIVVTDAVGCSAPADTVTVANAPELLLNLAPTGSSCFGNCDGEITATLTNGVGAITWSPVPNAGQGTSVASYTGLCSGFYTIDVEDGNGCMTSDTISLYDPQLYDIDVTIYDIQCFGGNSGAINLDVNAGGNGGAYTYSWLPPTVSGAGTDSIFNLSAGFYQVTISDGTCDTTMLFTMTDPVELTATASIISQSFCAGDCNGSGDVVAGGGAPPYNIQWNDPSSSTSNVISNLCPGTFIATITDDNGCTAQDSITITEPALFNFTPTFDDVTCFGSCDGVATISSLTGGTPGYTIQWDDPLNQTGPLATNLCAGVYQATITDANGCDSIVTFTISEPAEIVPTTNLNNSACFGSCSGETSVTVVGGTGALSYEWYNVNSNIPVNLTDINPNLCSGDYYVVVTDAANCSVISDTLTVTENPEIIVNLVSSTNATCGANDGSATISASGGTGTLTYVWTPTPGAGAGTPSISNLSGGIYTVVVTDQSMCSDSLAVPISSSALEILTVDSVDVSCFGLSDGEVSVNFTCLQPTCSIEWFDGGGNSVGTTNTVTGLPAGLYLVELTNGMGCTVIDSTHINDAPEILTTISSTDISCFGDNNGTSNVIATGGAGGYTYNWTPSPGGGQGTPNVSGLSAGQWNVTVTDADNCSVEDSTIVSEPTDLILNLVTSTNISCFGANDGEVGAIASGGVPGYTFEWFSCASGLSIGTGANITGLGPGEYFVVATDASNCTETSACVQVLEHPQLSAILNSTNVDCFGQCNGSITAVPSGGNGTYFYQWQDEFLNDIPGQTNSSMTNICQGIYNLELTDGNGCSVTLGPVNLTQPSQPWDITVSTVGINCFGNCTGSGTVTVNSGNTAPYSYQWDDPFTQTSPTATSLCAGQYNVIVSDAGTCDTTIVVTIADTTAIVMNAAITNINCSGDCTGEVVLSPSGGTGPYTIIWSDAQTGTTASNLCVGNITGTVTDDVGCSIDTTITITQPLQPLTVTSSFVNITQCGQCNGSATVNVSGGTPGYTYVWSTAGVTGQGTNHVSGLCAGLISVEITDDNGCTIIETFVIQDAQGEVFTLNTTDASCFNTCDGTASLTYTCNSPVCSQIWIDAATGTALAETGTSVNTLCAGDYLVQLTNGVGCVSAQNFTISSPTQIDIDETITQTSCAGANDGSIAIVASGGSGSGYSYTWNPVPPSGQNSNPATGLSPGSYDLTVEDGTNCTESETYNIIGLTAINLVTTPTDPTCNGVCDGNIAVAATGGDGNFTYQWFDNGTLMPGETGPAVFGLCAGSYNVTVTDGTGCSESLTNPIVITEPSPVTIIIGDEDINCFGDCDGLAHVTPSGGVGSYVINWYDGATNMLIGQANDTAYNLCAGDYYAVIADANNCMVTSSFATITEPPEFLFTLNHQDIDCFGECDGNAAITVSGGVQAYTYEWLDNTSTPIGTDSSITNVCAGGYTVEAIDANGCTTGPQIVTILEPQDLTADIFVNNADCNVASGSATANGVGGFPGYMYQWLDNAQQVIAGETSSTILNVFSGTYYIEITDANLCVDTFEVVIVDNPVTSIVFDNVTDPSCFGGNDGSIDISIVSTNLPLNFLWLPGGMVVEDPNNLSAGAYQLQVTDGVGCVSIYDTVLVDPPEIVVTPNVTDPECGLCDGEIETTVAGGVGTLTLNWNSGQTVEDITNLCPGIYELNIEDDNGCTVNELIPLGNSDAVTATTNVTPISCYDYCDGEITVNITSGIAPFTVNWLNDGFVGTSRTNLCADTYLIEVIDSAGCIFPMVVELANPTPLVITESFTLPNCGANDGEISVVTSGGVLPHTYSWNTLPDITPTVSGLGAGIYILTVTDNNGAGCAQDVTFELSNATVPQIELTATDLNCADVCDGSITSAVSGGTPGYNYQWYDEFGGALTGETNADLLNLCAGSYTLEVTDLNSCIAFASDVINSPDSLNFNSLFVDNVNCFGDCDGSIGALILGGVVPYTYAWDDINNQSTPTAVNLCDGTYNLLVTDANNCTITLTDSIVEPDELTLTVDAITSSQCQNTTDGEVQITVNGGTPDYSFEWTLNSNVVSNSEDLIGVVSGKYYIAVTDANNCVVNDSATLDPAILVEAFAGNDTLICFGADFTAIGTSNQPTADFTWFDADANNVSDTNELVLSNLSTGVEIYVLQASFNGCDDTDSLIVTIGNAVIVDAGPDSEVPSIGSIQIGGDPTAVDVDTITWSPAIYLNDTTISNPTVIKPKVDTWYYVTAIDSNGCIGIDSMFLLVVPDIIIPNGVSPNSDGKNDTWILDFKEDFPNLEVSVFNRWGDLLFYDNAGYLVEWDGKYEGKELPVGTYYYTINLHNEFYPEPFTGPITIMR